MTVLSDFLRDRTEHFTGRQWVFDRIGAWLSDDAAAPVFLLTGGPGTGKTAIAVRVAQMTLGETPAAHPALGKDRFTYCHFCQAGVESTLSPVTFVQSLSQALANRYPAFRDALQKAGSRQIVINAVQTFGTVEAGAQVVGAQIGQINIEIKGGDARSVFDDAVRRPLLAMAPTLAPGERVVVLVDSLDEALGFSADNNIAQLLAVATDFPPQVRFLVTSRSNSDRVFDLVGKSTLDLLADAPPNVDEVKPYVLAHLAGVPEPDRSVAAARIAAKSEGNFLYAHHVVLDLLARGALADADTLDLPDSLEGVYRKYLQRELGSNPTRWNDGYRPILGSIAVARGEGLTRNQLIGITHLAEDTATDVLGVCAQYLAGGTAPAVPYRIYHQSFRDFLLDDKKFTVYPAERHSAIARYLQDRCGANWGRCDDQYALRYTPAHWADAATLSEVERDTRTHALIDVASNHGYQQRFESRVADLPLLHSYLNRAVQVASLNDRDDMLPAIVKAARDFIRFRRDYLRSESVVALAEQGRLDQAEARLPLFVDVDQDWQAAARLILAWLAAARNPPAAMQLRDSVANALPPLPPLNPLPLLLARVSAALAGQALFPAIQDPAMPLDYGRQLVKRISGQDFDRELLGAVNSSLMAGRGFQVGAAGGYASSVDAPVLVSIARVNDAEGTPLVDEYVDAHAGYNYVEYRNQSLWQVLGAVLSRHDNQDWVRDRLRRVAVAALSGGGVDFEEMLPVAARLLSERAHARDPRALFDTLRIRALAAADALQQRRGANDSWGNHRRRLTALMELSHLVLGDVVQTQMLLNRILALPDGFAGFLAPARLRLADALRACRMEAGPMLEQTLQDALKSAHHIQDYHFCARVTARCNALIRWHRTPLFGKDLVAAIQRLAGSPNDVEFAADHLIREPYGYRPGDPDMLSIDKARDAVTIEDLVEVFQRSAVDFRRLNPRYAIDAQLPGGTPIRVPDPGLAPLLAVHLGARALADDTIVGDRAALIRALVPIAAANPTTLDTVLSYLVVAADLQDATLADEIVAEAGAVVFGDVAAPSAQIGPDAVMPT